MTEPDPHEVTQLLVDWSDGDHDALDKLVPLVEAELRRLAHQYMNRERYGHTLQTTALVNEAYIRLVNQKISWQSRAHFFGISARLMRQILVDYARKRQYLKRGGGQALMVSLDEAAVVAEERAAEMIALDEALQELAEIAPEQTSIVELKFFGGLTIEEIAEVMHLSPDRVKRDWSMARTWLYQRIKE